MVLDLKGRKVVVTGGNILSGALLMKQWRVKEPT
jgi:hypothetical protein